MPVKFPVSDFVFYAWVREREELSDVNKKKDVAETTGSGDTEAGGSAGH